MKKPLSPARAQLKVISVLAQLGIESAKRVMQMGVLRGNMRNFPGPHK